MNTNSNLTEKEITIGNDTFELMIEEAEIKKRIKEIAREISSDYKDKEPIIVGALNGAFIFIADLVREITIPCEIDFLKVSSYGNEKTSSGKVKLLTLLNRQFKDRHVIIIDDIVDSGLTIDFMKNLLKDYHTLSIKVVALLYKKEADKYKYVPDYVGFEIPNKFVIGYGLDYAQKYRNLKHIYVLK